jgi:hypothetical protein
MGALQQVVSQQPSYSLHFMQLSGPEAELQATTTAAAQTGASAEGALFVSMLRAAPSWGNITYDAFVAGEQVKFIMRWCRFSGPWDLLNNTWAAQHC